MLLTKVIVLQENTYLEVLFVVLCMSFQSLGGSYLLDTHSGIPSWLSLRIVSAEMFENIYPRVEWRPKPFRLQRSLNSVYRVNLKYAKVRTGSHLRNSQSVERSFSGPRTYLRAGWNRIDRKEKKLSSVLTF